MSASVNVLAAALHGHKLTKRETKRAATFLELFLVLTEQDKFDVLRVMQALAFVGGNDLPATADKLTALLAAERNAVSTLWSILHELRIGGHLPAWAQALDAGTDRQFDGLESARAQLDNALADAIPGFIPTRKRPPAPIPPGTL